MASRKDLKKSVKAISDNFAYAANTLLTFCNPAQQEKLTAIIVDLYNLENETLQGVARSRRSEDPKREFFRNLIEAHNQKIDKIEEKISSLESEIFSHITSSEKEKESAEE